jgi:hypothetical protein
MAYFGTCHEGTAAGITVDGSAETETAAMQRRELVAAITKDVRLSHLRCIDQWQPPQLWPSQIDSLSPDKMAYIAISP